MANNTLQGTIAWAQTFFEYAPVTAGTGFEPAITIASMIRNTMQTSPFNWSWNRVEDSSQSTVVGVQDYTYAFTNFGHLEKVSLIDPNNNIFEVKDILNTDALSKGGDTQQPHAISVIANSPGTSFKIRFMGIPDQVYTIVLTYQALAVQFAAFTVTAVANSAGGNTAYTGTFTPTAFPVGSIASIQNCTTAANNGTFVVVSCNSTALVLNNPSGVAESETGASAINQSWAPIPDSYSNIYNNLFLGEAFASVDDTRSQLYRQRGVAALLAKAEGLNDTQKQIFAQQYLAQSREGVVAALKAQQGVAARGM